VHRDPTPGNHDLDVAASRARTASRNRPNSIAVRQTHKSRMIRCASITRTSLNGADRPEELMRR
jgi:hypothetical protein